MSKNTQIAELKRVNGITPKPTKTQLIEALVEREITRLEEENKLIDEKIEEQLDKAKKILADAIPHLTFYDFKIDICYHCVRVEFDKGRGFASIDKEIERLNKLKHSTSDYAKEKLRKKFKKSLENPNPLLKDDAKEILDSIIDRVNKSQKPSLMCDAEIVE